AATGVARADAAFAPCSPLARVECATVVVPLDRTGVVPGRVRLHVERLASPNPQGVVLLLAGGPGQAGAAAYGLAHAASDPELRMLADAGYTLMTFDPRGTGESGRLSCALLERSGGQI